MRRVTGSSSARSKLAGVTLVEMLVAMVILGFVLTLVSQAVGQVTQLVRAAEGATREITEGWSGAGVLRPAVSNLVLPDEKAQDAFKGSAQSVEGYTTLALDGADKGVQPMHLEIRVSALDGQSEIWWTTGKQGLAQRVARLNGRYEFAFVDTAGALGSSWPRVATAAATPGSVATDVVDEALPAALVLREVGTGKAVLWVALQGERLRPKPAGKPFWETT